MLDKIPVTGLPLIQNICQLLLVTNVLGLVINVMDICHVTVFGIFRPTGHAIQTRGICLSTLQFFIQAPIYFMSLLFALVSYNNLQTELCFHCKYGFFVL